MTFKLSSLVLLLVYTLNVCSAFSPQDYVINADNASRFGYQITVEEPGSDEPAFKRLHITFPRQLDDGFSYAYSSALYARDGKRLLAYRPQDISRSLEVAEFYILMHQDIAKCLSLVNVYHQDRDQMLHPPSRQVTINLASFVGVSKECIGGDSASNYW